MAGVTDWVAWHRGYDDPASSLSRRLAVVRELVGTALRATPPPRRVLSLCAGDGRDLLPLLAAEGPTGAAATLVELDPRLADAARESAAGLGLAVDVRCADAGDASCFRDVLPVDVLLLCGVFGNVSTPDVERTLAVLPAMLRPGGHVVWTRGNHAPDLREHVRALARAAGCTELRYEGPPQSYEVGLARLDLVAPQPAGPAQVPSARVPDRLFTFVR